MEIYEGLLDERSCCGKPKRGKPPIAIFAQAGFD
jgi:hypothetical protein